MPLRALSLFSGVGGLDSALEMAGIEIAAFCEVNPFCRQVLAKRWPGVPIFDDVRTITAELIRDRGIGRIDVVAGGFPCQDVSVAGKGAGIAEGTRSGLWFDMLRIIRAVRPRYALVENVAALLGRGFGGILCDVAEIGFDAEWGCIRASHVGAPHRRERIFIVAYSNGAGCEKLVASAVPNCTEDGYRGANEGGKWPTPRAEKTSGYSSNGYSPTLEEVVNYAGFALRGSNEVMQWPTPDANSGNRGSGTFTGTRPNGAKQTLTINQATRIAESRRNYPTPKMPTGGGQVERTTPGGGIRKLEDAISADIGRPTSALNPDWVEILVGLPIGWTDPDMPNEALRPWPGWPASPGQSQHDYEPPRVLIGVKNRCERLKACGNIVVPQQALVVTRLMAAHAEAGGVK